MQALKLIVIHAFGFGQLEHRRYRVGIVGGELRIDPVGHVQQLGCAGEERNVTAGLAGEYRETAQAHYLGAFDLGVPVRAFYQAHHKATVVLLSQPVQPVQREG